MLIDRYPKEEIFARVPKMAERIDPVLRQLDRLLDDDTLYQQVRADFGKRYRFTLVHGRHSTPVEVLLRMLLRKHLYGWSYQETEDRVEVIAQSRRRVLEGKKVPSDQKVLRLFEPHTRAIPRHKGGALVEFGRQVILDEVEGGIVTRYEILKHPNEHGQAIGAVAHHVALFDHPPGTIACDRGVHSPETEATLQEAGVKRVAIPASGKLSEERRALEHTRPWRRGYRWRAGIEGRIASLRRD